VQGARNLQGVFETVGVAPGPTAEAHDAALCEDIAELTVIPALVE
jgi:hypothetical protein